MEVREREFSLFKAGKVVPVEPKAFRVLHILLRNPQKLLPEDELLNAVWGGDGDACEQLTQVYSISVGNTPPSPYFCQNVYCAIETSK